MTDQPSATRILPAHILSLRVIDTQENAPTQPKRTSARTSRRPAADVPAARQQHQIRREDPRRDQQQREHQRGEC